MSIEELVDGCLDLMDKRNKQFYDWGRYPEKMPSKLSNLEGHDSFDRELRLGVLNSLKEEHDRVRADFRELFPELYDRLSEMSSADIMQEIMKLATELDASHQAGMFPFVRKDTDIMRRAFLESFEQKDSEGRTECAKLMLYVTLFPMISFDMRSMLG